MKLAMVWCAALMVIGCKSKAKDAPAAGSGSDSPAVAPAPGSATAPPGSAAPPPAPAPTPAPPPPPAAHPSDELPQSADVLPKGEATPKARVVTGDGFRFQIPDDFQIAAHAGEPTKYTGSTDKGRLTLWATVEPYDRQLAALVEREKKTAADGGGEVRDPGSAGLYVAGATREGYARRITLVLPDHIELRTMVLHEGKAYVHHCSTPNVASAWASVGPTCIALANTFHIAPTAFVDNKRFGSKQPPPDIKNVELTMSKVEGTARDKQTVNNWLSDLEPYLKPCVSELGGDATWAITFDLAKDGTASNPALTGGPGGGKLPGPPEALACIAKVLETAKIDGEATATVRVSAMLEVK